MIKESKIYIKSIFRWKVTLSQKGLGSLFRSSFLQKRFCYRCFPVSFARYCRTIFLQNVYRWLLLLILTLSQKSLSYRNQSIDLLCKLIDLYDRHLHHQLLSINILFYGINSQQPLFHFILQKQLPEMFFKLRPS